MDFSSIIGLIIGVSGIVGGYYIEGGHVFALIQVASALIVFGGTLGATISSHTFSDIQMAAKIFLSTFRFRNRNYNLSLIEQIVDCARVARQKSILSLEERLEKFSNPFMKDVFRSLIDGMNAENLRDVFESEITSDENKKIAAAKVWADAGAYAPTIGIVGAVLGLIEVMRNLTDTESLGKGIAVAFIATIYGIGSANLIFIPISNKIQSRVRNEVETKQMILEGAIGIVKGHSPYIINEKVRSYIASSNLM